MDRSEWCTLPLPIALGVLYDGSQAVQKLVAAAEAPKKPHPPKYDFRVYRKGGFNWASEMELESLQWWYSRALESAESGSEYAERDRKKAETLYRWTTWRSWEPTAIWQGTRGDGAAKARPPSRNPELHSPLPVESGDADDDFPDAF